MKNSSILFSIVITILCLFPVVISGQVAMAQEEVGSYDLKFAPVDGERYVYELTTRGTRGESIVVSTEDYTIDVSALGDGSFEFSASGERIPDNAPVALRFQRELFDQFVYTIDPNGGTVTDQVQPFPPFFNVPILPDSPVDIDDTWSGGPVDILPDMNVSAIPFVYESKLTEEATFRGQNCVVIETVLSVALGEDAVSYMPFLGIVEGDVPEDKVGQGAYIGGVIEDSPANEAGIEPGDVVTEAEGIRIRGWGGLQDIMPVIPLGLPIELTIEREKDGDTESLEIEITPERIPLARISGTGGLYATTYFSLESHMPLKIDVTSHDLEFTLENSDGDTETHLVDFSYILEFERKSGG